MATSFANIYNRFLDKITDDMYMEMTPQETLKDLQRLLINAIPDFEFPRKSLEYTIVVDTASSMPEDENVFVSYVPLKSAISTQVKVEGTNLILGSAFSISPGTPEERETYYIDKSYFSEDLSPEELNILSLLMMCGWIQRQVTSVEHTRMKYSSSDFKFTSQANHLQKLMALLEQTKTQAFHMQRLYKRRKMEDGVYKSTWSSLKGVYGE